MVRHTLERGIIVGYEGSKKSLPVRPGNYPRTSLLINRPPDFPTPKARRTLFWNGATSYKAAGLGAAALEGCPLPGGAFRIGR